MARDRGLEKRDVNAYVWLHGQSELKSYRSFRGIETEDEKKNFVKIGKNTLKYDTFLEIKKKNF